MGSLPSEVFAAIIAVTGVSFSAVVAWAVARRASRTELRKQELALYQTYAASLQESRLTAYRTAYRLISNCLKKLNRSEISTEDLAILLREFQAWDSENSLLLSNDAAKVAFDFQWYLHHISVEAAEPLSEESLNQLGVLCEKLELALKTDLGVFAVEYEDKRRVSFYQQ